MATFDSFNTLYMQKYRGKPFIDDDDEGTLICELMVSDLVNVFCITNELVQLNPNCVLFYRKFPATLMSWTIRIAI